MFMGQELKGGPVAAAIRAEMTEKIEKFKERGQQVRIAVFRVGNREDDLAYERRVLSNCEKLGIKADVLAFEENVSTPELKEAIEKANQNRQIHGILLFRPLPRGLDEALLVESIDPKKDIDCSNPENLNKVFQGQKDGFYPCTPEAVMEILKFYQVPLQGARVAVVNRSMVLGKPLSMMLLSANATVTVCHSKTKDIAGITKESEVVITGVGKADYFDEGYFHQQAVVIDVGINMTEKGLRGDVDYERVLDHVRGITPVPGGVGAVTSTILLRHAVEAAERSFHE